MLDALVEACRRLQSTDLLPEAHGATPRVTVTMDFTDLRDQSGYGTTETGEQLTAAALRRICCEAEVIPAVLGTNSAVLDVGRTQRLVTTAIWKALVARDQHCRFPNCTRPPLMCHAHHLVHWADGGATSLAEHDPALRPPPPPHPPSTLGHPENQPHRIRLPPTTRHPPRQPHDPTTTRRVRADEPMSLGNERPELTLIRQEPQAVAPPTAAKTAEIGACGNEPSPSGVDRVRTTRSEESCTHHVQGRLRCSAER